MKDPEIASLLGVPYGDPRSLYGWLADDGFPICRKCGENFPEEGHDCDRSPEEPVEEEPVEEPERKARGGMGEPTEPPPLEGAAVLFRRALAELTWNVDRLREREVYLKDGRFNTHDAYTDPVYWKRYEWVEQDQDLVRVSLFSDEQWEALCEAAGQDPDSEIVDVSSVLSVLFPRGGAKDPPKLLVALIAAYALSGQELDPLIEQLHLAPESLDRDRLKKLIEGETTQSRGKDGRITTQKIPGLWPIATQIARMVCGGEMRTGRPPEELSPEEQLRAWYILQRVREGASEDEINRELEEQLGLSPEEVSRLRNLGLRLPD